MIPCRHTTLELLPEPKAAVRCRRCHLTISSEELGDGYCPECFESSGTKNYDFEPVAGHPRNAVRYRCAECGAIIVSGEGGG